VIHAYNHSYSGNRDQKDKDSSQPQANSSQDPISKKSNTKKDWWSGSNCNSICIASFRPQCHKKKKKLKNS
jgi:hypothetical protein